MVEVDSLNDIENVKGIGLRVKCILDISLWISHDWKCPTVFVNMSLKSGGKVME